MKPNVLFIIDSFEQGGSERQALQLLRQLHSSGEVRVHLACLQDRGSLRADAEALLTVAPFVDWQVPRPTAPGSPR